MGQVTPPPQGGGGGQGEGAGQGRGGGLLSYCAAKPSVCCSFVGLAGAPSTLIHSLPDHREPCSSLPVRRTHNLRVLRSHPAAAVMGLSLHEGSDGRPFPGAPPPPLSLWGLKLPSPLRTIFQPPKRALTAAPPFVVVVVVGSGGGGGAVAVGQQSRGGPRTIFGAMETGDTTSHPKEGDGQGIGGGKATLPLLQGAQPTPSH